MYLSPVYQEHDAVRLAEFVRRYSFATLFTPNLLATRMPFELSVDVDGAWSFMGHFAAANPQAAFLNDAQPAEVLLVFDGAHAYISPTHYTHVSAPTWNYMSLHCRGTARLVRDEEWLRSLLHRQIETYEPVGGFSVNDLPPNYINRLLHAFVGIEIKVSHCEAIFKLSQEKDAQSYGRVMHALAAADEPNQKQELAAAMQAYWQLLFGEAK